jgi:hypothetical protein
MFKDLKKQYSNNPFQVVFKLLILFSSFLLFFERIWVGEDAFIFFRYVHNLVSGNGLVFNVGERIEGFTSPLWVFVLSLSHIILGWEYRQLAIVLGLLFGTLTIFMLLFKDSKSSVTFSFGVLVLIANSAFRDFVTSGFETSLVLFLLTLVALDIKNMSFLKKSLKVGLLVGLLVLARPETFLIFAFLMVLYLLNAAKQHEWKLFIKYLLFPALLVGGYQIFRLGYYSSLLPNTFYAKHGGDLYFVQGLNYILDFFNSYPLTIILLVVVVLLVFLNKYYRWVIDKDLKGRIYLLGLSLALSSYVLFSGGDFMHGRSLLMAFLLLAIALNDFPEIFINDNWSSSLGPKWFLTIILSSLVVFIGILQRPYTVRKGRQINYINDERTHFGFDNVTPDEWGEYLKLPITGEFGWAARGNYYKDIAQRVEEPILVYMPNIGFFGHASGENVSVMGTSLIDGYQARTPLEVRGKIGHEDELRWDYLLYRKPSFAYTPFKQWNSSAQFRYETSEYASVIVDDQDDSFIPVFDLSNTNFIDKYSKLVEEDVLAVISSAQREYLIDLTDTHTGEEKLEVGEYLGFLRYYWLPYTSSADRSLYWEKRTLLFGAEDIISSYERFEVGEKAVVDAYWEGITRPLTFETFVSNMRSVF